MDAWFDPTAKRGCLALSLRLPLLVPLSTIIPVDIDTERLQNSGYYDMPIDTAWLDIPTTIRLFWNAFPIDPPALTTADYSARALELVTGAEAPLGITMPGRPGMVSVVTALIPVSTEDPHAQTLEREGAFGPVDAAVWAIGDLVRAARLLEGIPPLPDVTVESLPGQSVPVTYATVAKNQLIWGGEVWRHRIDGPMVEVTRYRDTPLSEADQGLLVDSFADLRVRSPSYVLHDLFARADAALDAGQPENAVIGYAITCEYLVTNLALAVAWEAANSDSDAAVDSAAKTLAPWAASIQNLLERCSPIGGGHWNDREPIVVAWMRDVAQLRNRLVHRGSSTTMHHARRARGAAADLIEMVKQRLVSTRDYPQTRAQFTGYLSVEQWSSKRRREEHEQRLADRDSYLSQSESFRDWRDRVYEKDPRP